MNQNFDAMLLSIQYYFLTQQKKQYKTIGLGLLLEKVYIGTLSAVIFQKL